MVKELIGDVETSELGVSCGVSTLRGELNTSRARGLNLWVMPTVQWWQLSPSLQYEC